MWPSVASAFPSFTDRFEGVVRIMYRDVKNLVTTGRGNLIDPVGASLGLPFVFKKNGQPATRAQIADEWERIKSAPGLDTGGWRAANVVATLWLTPDAIDALTLDKLRENDEVLASRFQGWSDVPSDAQLATHSLAWACGSRFSFPRFEAALNARDFAACAVECQMDATGNPGLVPRNAANRALFESAAKVVAEGLDPSILLYARTTEPELPSPSALAAEATDGVLDG